MNATNAQYPGVATAPIWLGPDASGCLVVGGKAPATVLDQGSGDTLINVTQIVDPPLAAHSMKADTVSKFGFARLP